MGEGEVHRNRQSIFTPTGEVKSYPQRGKIGNGGVMPEYARQREKKGRGGGGHSLAIYQMQEEGKNFPGFLLKQNARGTGERPRVNTFLLKERGRRGRGGIPPLSKGSHNPQPKNGWQNAGERKKFVGSCPETGKGKKIGFPELWYERR